MITCLRIDLFLGQSVMVFLVILIVFGGHYYALGKKSLKSRKSQAERWIEQQLYSLAGKKCKRFFFLQ